MKDAIFWILFFVSVGCFYMSGRINGENSYEKEIATACSSGNRQFVIDNNTFICGQLTHTTPDKLEKQRKEYYGDQCSRLFHGMENDFDER